MAAGECHGRQVHASEMANGFVSHGIFSLFGLGTSASLPLSQSDANHFLWPMEQKQHHQILANGPPPLKYFGLLPTQPDGMLPRRRRLRREIGSSSQSLHKAAKMPGAPLHTSLKAYFPFHSPLGPRIFFWIFPLPCPRATTRPDTYLSHSSISARPLSGCHTMCCATILDANRIADCGPRLILASLVGLI
jgi:hypothetical protein